MWKPWTGMDKLICTYLPQGQTKFEIARDEYCFLTYNSLNLMLSRHALGQRKRNDLDVATNMNYSVPHLQVGLFPYVILKQASWDFQQSKRILSSLKVEDHEWAWTSWHSHVSLKGNPLGFIMVGDKK